MRLEPLQYVSGYENFVFNSGIINASLYLHPSSLVKYYCRTFHTKLMTVFEKYLCELKQILRERNILQEKAKAYMQFTEINKSYNSGLELNNKHP